MRIPGSINVLSLRLLFLWLAISIRANFYGYSYAYTCWHSKKFSRMWKCNLHFRNELKRIALDKLEYNPSLLNEVLFSLNIPYITARKQRVQLYLYIAFKLPSNEIMELMK